MNRYASAQCNLGVALFYKGDTDGAVDAFQAALRAEPEHPQARAGLLVVTGE